MKTLKNVIQIERQEKKSQLVVLEGYNRGVWIKHKNNGKNAPLNIGDVVEFWDNSIYTNERKQRLSEILKMDIIPATEENISLLLEHLNNTNWGSWNLPKMSISYSAHQYDCDGTTITTITLSNPIIICGESHSKFKSGVKRGHLENYILI